MTSIDVYLIFSQKGQIIYMKGTKQLNPEAFVSYADQDQKCN